MLEEIRRANRATRVQYSLMLIFGTLCVLTAFAPLEESIRITTVGTLFGFTAGLWVAHLVQVLQRAANMQKADVTG
ncbi:hypothetical protein SAMN05421858_1151 [Haladaptatus litoreus]|uniref:Uncharacterized protein n=1 Tax=Haladaptatus litoreus TaxID=553468 RepID=A0A1N6XIP7_9EURY|nr:hypothetical protein [Haladaptatus litoreus]SIR02256.1 hypothetical protein SAMN05421858_1151 [Haladaptatus litoreus]